MNYHDTLSSIYMIELLWPITSSGVCGLGDARSLGTLVLQQSRQIAKFGSQTVLVNDCQFCSTTHNALRLQFLLFKFKKSV